VRVRQWQPSDERLLVSGFYRLSPTSSYRRFLSASPVLGRQALHQLTDIDHCDTEAMLALDVTGSEGLGIARYARSPERSEVAEVALTVIDEWQDRGLGTLLLDVIGARARQEGINTFTALMLAENREMRDLLDHLGPVRVLDEERGTVEVEVPIPTPNLSPELSKLLRTTAGHDATSPPTLEGDDGTTT
jgi:GNAT superfamily N-acetyltransferase